jgi:threonylcarbamoyladenosine tRNA methylthiotransferase MtaB
MIPNGKLCRFLHIPLQNADDQILKAMNRKHSYNDFADLVMTIKKTIPEICIGTDIIVGFPNETKTHFMTAYKRLTDLPLSYFHVFSYSPRPNAKSCRLKDNVTPKAKAERSKTLRELSVLKRKAFYQGFLQTKQTVLFEERKEGIWSGLTDHYIRVRLRSEENLHNQLKDIHIKKAEQGFLWGKFSS